MINIRLPKEPRKRYLLLGGAGLAVCLLLGGIYWAWPRPSPLTPPPSGLATLPPQALQPTVAVALAQTETVASPQDTPAAPAGQAQPSPASSLSPTSCQPPAGWVAYTVQPGDTLYSLARQTGTSPEEIQRANCLSDVLIYVNARLYLPQYPPAPPPAPPAAPAAPGAPAPEVSVSACPSPFRCKDPDLPRGIAGETLHSPGPGEGDEFKTPCQWEDASAAGKPHISFRYEQNGKLDILEVGETGYYFACNYPNPADLKAILTGPDGRQTALPARYVLPSAFDAASFERAGRAYSFPALCSLPAGDYTLLITDGQAQDSITITLAPEDLGFTVTGLMVTPRYASPGEEITVHYCNYPAGAQVTTAIYHYACTEKPARPSENPLDRYEPYDTWSVTAGPNGQAVYTLQSLPDDPPGPYLLNVVFVNLEPRTLDRYDVVWLAGFPPQWQIPCGAP